MDDQTKQLMRAHLAKLQEDYSRRLREAARARSKDQIGNCYPWHTALALTQLFETALDGAQPVRILSGGVPESFYTDQVFRPLGECVAGGCDVKILVWHRDQNVIGPPFRDFASAYMDKENLAVRITGQRLAGMQSNHFTVVGDHAYRLENVHADFYGVEFDEFEPQVSATICFNDPSTAGLLSTLFDQAWRLGESVMN